ncbi:MAG: FMN-binding protein [Clostridiales bacterium]|nr:FMN-binding protein [Clostridiales bacterium]
MKKILAILLCAAITIGFTACGGAETLTGKADGYGGLVTVTVKKKGDKITSVKVEGDKETQEVAKAAFDEIPDAIVKANSTDVDVVSGATVTSKAIIYAVNNALDPEKYPYPIVKDKEDPEEVTAANVFQGFGISNMGRIGPGTDDKDVPVYSFNQVLANVLFDENDKIIAIHVDQIEVATPNYDGEGMPEFSGFPGQGSIYSDDTDDSFMAEVNTWKTKRDRGDTYKMGTGTWAEQMDTFEKVFVGKTVAEVEDWFKKYCSDINGRPLKADSTEDEDATKYNALSDDEKAMLADVVTGATMSLNDSHGDIVAAIKNAFDNKVGLDIESATGLGIGISNMGRLGPGTDDNDVPVYSFNQVFANTLFDKDGKIVAIHVDQMEVASPNYDSDDMPKFAGYPNSSDDVTDDNYLTQISAWKTKRERGDTYKMGTGTWAEQMDAFEKVFVGKTVDEVEDWFKKYCSDINGRPLKADSTEDKDTTKYNALSDDEKAMLADVVTGATMSLNDSHGDIIAAIKASFENRVTIDVKAK